MAVITKNVRVARTQGVILGLFLVFICATSASKSGACESVATHFQSKGFSVTQLTEQPTNG